VRLVEEQGIEEARKVPGYYDEPLSGDREGQRSIRLNIQWRAIYTVDDSGEMTIVAIEEVTPHDY
jgi:proteic killer suppression protein